MTPPFRDIRRTARALTTEQAREILARAEHGVLATVGAGGWPYAVPVNHVLSGGHVRRLDGDVNPLRCLEVMDECPYDFQAFAPAGVKLDDIAHEDRVSFCAVASATVLPHALSTLYESAVVFGRAAVVTDPAEKRRALELLAVRFCGAVTPEAENTIATDGSRTAVVRIRIERITGKAHRPAVPSD